MGGKFVQWYELFKENGVERVKLERDKDLDNVAEQIASLGGHSKWKNRSKFLTPLKWLFWYWLSLLDLRECILAIFGSPGPLGGVKGGMGGSGGVPGTKNCNFFGSHIWVTNWEILDCMNWKHFIFQVFGQKWPLRRPKMVIFGLKWVNTKVHFSQKHPLQIAWKRTIIRVLGQFWCEKSLGFLIHEKFFTVAKIGRAHVRTPVTS